MDVTSAIDRGDLDELQRLIEACCDAGAWDALVEVRDRAARAFERGRQLWPTAASAEYRLALEGPARYAAGVLVEGTGRFAPGPLAEVAASTHSWTDLAPHVADGPVAVVAMHERVVRGEDCTHGALPGPAVLELPRRLASWEPAYALAEYHADHGDFPAPQLPPLAPLALPGAATTSPSSDAATEALAALAAAWTDTSDGRAEAVAIDGDAPGAIAALGVRSARAAPLDLATATAAMAWVGASGGAHGRRPGGAAGRFAAWWALAALTGGDLDEIDPESLGERASRLDWMAWDAGEPETGWTLRLAVADRERRRAWAFVAADAA